MMKNWFIDAVETPQAPSQKTENAHAKTTEIGWVNERKNR